MAELTYFNMSGLGDPVRVMLSYGKIEFVDRRVGKDEWAKIKPETAFGKLPRLVIDGLELYQSRAICRYIARKLKLLGKDDKAAARADMWVDTFADDVAQITRSYYVPDSTERTQNLDKIKTSELSAWLTAFENILEKNSSTFFVDNELTWADVMWFGYLFYISELLASTGEELLAGQDRLLKIYNTVKNSPGIQKWLETRPKSPADMRSVFR